jgi:hypothetical protein
MTDLRVNAVPPNRSPAANHTEVSNRAANISAREYGRIPSEVIQHLATIEELELEVHQEITAVARTGFDESKVRTVSENARTLKFEQSGFEAE